MNALIDKFPITVKINGAEVPINTDFRISIKFTDLMMEENLSEDETITEALRLYFSKRLRNKDEAVTQMLWFYQGGKELAKTISKSGEPIYSFNHDYDYIFAAFLDQYRIDLEEIKYLHWWKFRAMFTSLKDDSMIEKIMSYRAIDLRDVDKDQQKYYKKLKDIHKLPKRISDEQKKLNNELVQALMGDGDVSKILKRSDVQLKK